MSILCRVVWSRKVNCMSLTNELSLILRNLSVFQLLQQVPIQMHAIESTKLLVNKHIYQMNKQFEQIHFFAFQIHRSDCIPSLHFPK